MSNHVNISAILFVSCTAYSTQQKGRQVNENISNHIYSRRMFFHRAAFFYYLFPKAGKPCFRPAAYFPELRKQCFHTNYQKRLINIKHFREKNNIIN